jgi:hypothetical protein
MFLIMVMLVHAMEVIIWLYMNSSMEKHGHMIHANNILLAHQNHKKDSANMLTQVHLQLTHAVLVLPSDNNVKQLTNIQM